MKHNIKAINVFVGSKIEKCRIEQEFSQTEFAEKVKLSRASMANIEAGRQAVSLERLFEFGIILNIDPSYFMPTPQWYSEYKNKQVRKVINYMIIE